MSEVADPIRARSPSALDDADRAVLERVAAGHVERALGRLRTSDE